MQFQARVREAIGKFSTKIYKRIIIRIEKDHGRREMSFKTLEGTVLKLHERLIERVDQQYSDLLKVERKETLNLDMFTKVKEWMDADWAFEASMLGKEPNRIVGNYLWRIIGLIDSMIDGRNEPGTVKFQEVLFALYQTGYTLGDIMVATQKTKVAAASISPDVAMIILYGEIYRSQLPLDENNLFEIYKCIFDHEEKSEGLIDNDERIPEIAAGLNILIGGSTMPEDAMRCKEMTKLLSLKPADAKVIRRSENWQVCLERSRVAIELKTGFKAKSLLRYMQDTPKEDLETMLPEVVNFFLQWDNHTLSGGGLLAALIVIYRDFTYGKKSMATEVLKGLNRETGFYIQDPRAPTAVDIHETKHGHSFAGLWLLDAATVFTDCDKEKVECMMVPPSEYCEDLHLNERCAIGCTTTDWRRLEIMLNDYYADNKYYV